MLSLSVFSTSPAACTQVYVILQTHTHTHTHTALIPVDIMKRQAPSFASGSGSGEISESLSMIGKPGILGSYRIALNFDLSRDLSDISRADLLLYQVPTRTGPDYAIADMKQFVEIRTILESVGERHVVGGKYTELFDSGFKAFDITAAVKLWVLKGVTGDAVLEVVIYCYSSPHCSDSINGKVPAKVEFLYSSDEPDKEPRLIVVSKNPLEAELEAKRRKRNSDPDEPVFCSVNASTCCLQPLTINFKEDLGLTFIEEPKEFQANYCEGYCPELSGLDVMTPQRFQFLRLLGDGSPASSIEPCCTGSAYRPLDVLLNIYNRRTQQFVTIIDQLQQVSVTKCKCA